MAGKRIQFLGLPLDVQLSVRDVCDLLRVKGEGRLVAKLNPGCWTTAKRHPQYLNDLTHMTYVLADGEGVAGSCRVLTGEPCQRMSFDMSSLADPFFKTCVEIGDKVMLMGGKPGVAEDVKEKLLSRYPGLNIVETTHGFGDFQPKIDLILARSPDALIVGMGVPRQESFMIALRNAGFKGYAMTSGGFFDQYLLADEYYPPLIDKWNLRWAFRIYKEPRRLWRRYLIDYQRFIGLFIGALYRKYTQKASTPTG